MAPDSGHRLADVEDDGGRALHERLLRGEPTAPSDLANLYLEPLIGWLRHHYPHDDEALLDTVAITLILKVGKEPAQYDPDRSTLSTYLRMAARGDVKNARQSGRRRAARQVPLENVELRSPTRNRAWVSAADPAEARLIQQAQAARCAVILLDVEGEYSCLHEPTEDARMLAALDHRGIPAAGLSQMWLCHLVGRESANPDHPSRAAFSLRFERLSPYAIAELL
ncbi:MAG TPA: hypothetical protein VFH48_40545, partial [Chloroflexota bacterium]|nr:hypothetical protein [Chloroflexota bacterium]